jgi:choice-of-anchor A domain-containing protein
VPTALQPASATDSTFVAQVACPIQWPLLHSGPPAADAFDGNVSVLVGGNLIVRGSAAGAEGVVVTRGDASFARETPGAYEVGVTSTGSQVPPYAGSDMLVVGGNLAGDPATHLDVGQSLGGDVAVGGKEAPGTDRDLHGGDLDDDVADVTAPYDELLDSLGQRSADLAAKAANGSVEVTETAITLTGDGVSPEQVFTVDGAVLGADGSGLGRSLQVLGVPEGASVVVNLTGPAVDLDVDSLLGADGAVLDPQVDRAFVDLATHLLWNAPGATTVDLGGQAQLPGSLLVPSAPSTTTISGAGTNGRVLVAGDLVHTGAGRLHAYPFLGDPDLRCQGEVAHLGALLLDVEVDDPDKVVDPDRFYEGTFECRLNGVDVTPRDDTWAVRASADPRLLSDEVPVGATCTVTEQALQVPPAADWKWGETQFRPEKVKVAKRDPRSVVVVNRAVAAPPPSSSASPTSDPVPTLTADPEPATEAPEPDPVPSSGPTELPEPTNRPDPSSPSAQPTSEPTASSAPGTESPAPQADPPREDVGPGPLATTAPFTLRGAFVWGPLLMLSLLTMVLRTRKRPRRLH